MLKLCNSGIYRVAQKRPELFVTIMVYVLYREKFLFADL